MILSFNVTCYFIPRSSSLIPSLFSYPNRNIKSLSEIQIVQVACGYYHSLALSKGKQDSSGAIYNFLPGSSKVFNVLFHLDLNFKSKCINWGSVDYSFFFFLVLFYLLSCFHVIFFFNYFFSFLSLISLHFHPASILLCHWSFVLACKLQLSRLTGT